MCLDISIYLLFILIIFTAPTAVRDLSAVASSPESIYISWKHPQYPKSFDRVEVPVDILSLNLSGLNTFTNYSIHMSVRGEGVSDAPIEVEIIARTNSSGKIHTHYSI